MRRAILPCLLAGVLAFAAYSGAADTPANVQPMNYRASTIEGLKVRNNAGDDLGKIKDLVIDVRSGKVTYATLDFGGFLGIGDKLFAVPWHAFKCQTVNGEDELMLNVTKERLKDAPGFDKDHWPSMANPNWAKDYDTFYAPNTAVRK